MSAVSGFVKAKTYVVHLRSGYTALQNQVFYYSEERMSSS